MYSFDCEDFAFLFFFSFYKTKYNQTVKPFIVHNFVFVRASFVALSLFHLFSRDAIMVIACFKREPFAISIIKCYNHLVNRFRFVMRLRRRHQWPDCRFEAYSSVYNTTSCMLEPISNFIFLKTNKRPNKEYLVEIAFLNAHT